MITGIMVNVSAAIAIFHSMVYCPKNSDIASGMVLFLILVSVSDGNK